VADRKQYPESDPRYHTARLKQMLTHLVNHVRQDISKVNDPKAQALFETTAEVLVGLEKAYEDFERGNETAWKSSAASH
jgi:hypothetical protein